MDYACADVPFVFNIDMFYPQSLKWNVMMEWRGRVEWNYGVEWSEASFHEKHDSIINTVNKLISLSMLSNIL